jgi:hypothetical protein
MRKPPGLAGDYAFSLEIESTIAANVVMLSSRRAVLQAGICLIVFGDPSVRSAILPLAKSVQLLVRPQLQSDVVDPTV